MFYSWIRQSFQTTTTTVGLHMNTSTKGFSQWNSSPPIYLYKLIEWLSRKNPAFNKVIFSVGGENLIWRLLFIHRECSCALASCYSLYMMTSLMKLGLLQTPLLQLWAIQAPLQIRITIAKWEVAIPGMNLSDKLIHKDCEPFKMGIEPTNLKSM